MPNFNLGLFLLIIWEVFWKGTALWKAAKKGDLWWFIAIFIVNSFGLLPLFYLWRTKQMENTLNDTLKFLRLKK